jgi:putative membrane protein
MLLPLVAVAAVVVVALLHVVFFVLESILWTRPFGRKTFGLTAEVAESSKSLALNQGVYNLFLAAGLIWSLYAGPCGFEIRVFFLLCVIVAGLVGGFTAKRSILWIQALPAVIALLLVFFSQR